MKYEPAVIHNFKLHHCCAALRKFHCSTMGLIRAGYSGPDMERLKTWNDEMAAHLAWVAVWLKQELPNHPVFDPLHYKATFDRLGADFEATGLPLSTALRQAVTAFCQRS